jgi:signal peptidase I
MLRRILRLSGLHAVLAFLLARRVRVGGWSMYPTLAPGEYVLFDRLAYRLGMPRRGEVVLAAHPQRLQERIIKRVAALPGDRVSLREGGCLVNGQPIGGARWQAAAPGTECGLADDQYLLLGDALDLSTDSRHFGPVPRRQILARAWLVYWPLGRMRSVRG